MIVNIRGTGGSGKSHLVRRVMDLYAERHPRHVEGRRRPVSYLCSAEGHRPLLVPGHYETACGGCDTLKTVNQVYELVTAGDRHNCDVLYEGIMVADDVTRAVLLSRSADLRVVLLTTPIEECLHSIQARRAERGDERPLSEKNTRDRAKRHDHNVWRLKQASVRTERLDREAAFNVIRGWLGWIE